jgi:2-phosphoglycerate kinase
MARNDRPTFWLISGAKGVGKTTYASFVEGIGDMVNHDAGLPLPPALGAFIRPTR